MSTSPTPASEAFSSASARATAVAGPVASASASTASPRPTATASAAPVIPTPSLEDQVLDWAWTAFLILAMLTAIVYAFRYLDSIFEASQRQRADNGGLVTDESTRRRRRSNVVMFVLVGMTILGLVWIPMVPQLHGQQWVALELAAVGILLSGAFMGFLFGLPRLSDTPAASPAAGSAPTVPASLYRPSTNLEQVVDRIATLLAGVALAQLASVPGYVAQFADFIDAGLGGAGTIPFAKVLATGIMLYFAPLGFILSFLCTKTIVAPEIARADEALVGLERSKAIIDDFPTWPDVPPNPTAEQQAAAQRIVAVSLATLTTAAQKATWGRAQMLLGNLESALLAFQQAQVLTPNDPHLLADYAAALYQNDVRNANTALQLARRAESLAPIDDVTLRARLRSIEAVCALYLPGGYQEAIDIVNATLADPRLAFLGTRLRYYRACGFGQMWRAVAVQDPPDAQARLDAIAGQIVQDTRLSLTYEGMRPLFVLVVDPTGREDGSLDDDLQAFAAAHAEYRDLLGVTSAIPAPTTPVPPPPTVDPLTTVANCPA